jgi:type VI secretion system secreted protein VgrG
LHVEGTSQLVSSGITEIVSPKGLRLRCGESFIEIMEDQILLMSDKIMLHAPNAQVEVNDSGEVWVDADDKLVLKSDTVQLAGVGAMLSLAEKATLMGEQISLCKPDDVLGLDTEERELTTIELTDEDGEPCPNQRYILVFEDGSEQSGFLDDEGRVALYLEEGAAVRFPGLIDVANATAERGSP